MGEGRGEGGSVRVVPHIAAGYRGNKGLKDPTGRLAAVGYGAGGHGEVVSVVDLARGRAAWVLDLTRTSGGASGAAFSADGQVLALCGPYGGLLLYLAEDRQAPAEWLRGDVAAFAPDGELIWVAQGGDERRHLPGPAAGPPTLRSFTLAGTPGHTFPLAMNLPGRITFAAGGKTVSVEGVQGYGLGNEAGGHMEKVRQAIEVATGRSDVVRGEKERGWGAYGVLEALKAPDPVSPPPGAAVLGRGRVPIFWHAATRRMIVGNKAWGDIRRAEFEATLGGAGGMKPLGFAADGTLMATAWHDRADLPKEVLDALPPAGHLRMVELLTLFGPELSRARMLPIPAGKGRILALSPDEKHVAVIVNKTNERPEDTPGIEIRRLADGACAARIEPEGHQVFEARWSADGSRLGLVMRKADEPTVLAVYSVGGAALGRLKMDGHYFDFSPDGRLAAVGGGSNQAGGGRVCLVDVATGKPVADTGPLGGYSAFAGFISRGRLVVADAFSNEPPAALWDLAAMKPLWKTSCPYGVRGCAAPAGTGLLVLGYNGSADVLGLEDGRRLPLAAPAKAPLWHSPTAVGRGCVLEPLYDTTLIGLFEAATGRLLATFAAFTDADWLVWTPDGWWTGSEKALEWVSFYRRAEPLPEADILKRKAPDRVRAAIRKAFAN
jgi:hypothetical protein